MNRAIPTACGTEGSPIGSSTVAETWLSITRSLLRSELFRTRKRPLWWILLLLDLGSAAAYYGTATVVGLVRGDHSSGAAEYLLPQRMLESSVQLNALVVAIAILVFAATSIGNEFSWGTMRPLIARAGNRSCLLTAKWLSVGIVLVILQVLGFLACIVGSMAATLVVHHDLDISGALTASWGVGLIRLLVASLPITAIGFLVALISRSSTAGIGVGVGLVFLEPAGWAILDLMTTAFDGVRKIGIDYPTRRLMHYAYADTFNPVGLREGMGHAGICLVWTVAAMVCSYMFFRRRDVTS